MHLRSLLFLPAFLASRLRAATIPQAALSTSSHDDTKPLPLIIWHGLGDNFKAEGIQHVAALANRTNPGTYVYAIRLADDASGDKTATFWGNVTEQVAQVCAALAAHPVLSRAPAVNALGFSQGGQFLRAYVERCNAPPVVNLVTFGAQHNGIASFNSCGEGDWLCQAWEGVLRTQTWTQFVQSSLVPAQYFRDREDLPSYLESSNFLADVNNERAAKNATYKANLEKLERFVMYRFADDTVVVPAESSWFAEKNLTSGAVTPLRERAIYKEDWLGLKGLDERGALEFREVKGQHMALNADDLADAFERYFAPKAKRQAPAEQQEVGAHLGL